MKRHLLPALPMIVLVFSLTTLTPAQQGGGHMLFGDFKVDESKVSGLLPLAFFIVLYTETGKVYGRQSVPNNGRYRFNNVINGEYDLVVEVENQEVVRERIVVIERIRTDIRHDLSLEWKASPVVRNSGMVGSVAIPDSYKRQPKNEALFDKAESAMKKKDYKAAVALLHQIATAEPGDFVSWTELGTVYFKQGYAGEAEKSYLKALEVRPSFMLAFLNLGKVRMAGKNFAGAIEVLTKALQAEPQSSDANYLLGESYLQIKKGSMAVGLLNEALRLDPIGKAEAHLWLAALYNGAGVKDKAAAEYEAFLVKKPNYPDRKALERYISENKNKP